MSESQIIGLIVLLVGLVFNAGGLVYSFQRLKKDVDGVGRKVNALERYRSERELKELIAFLLLCTDDNKEKIANLLRN